MSIAIQITPATETLVEALIGRLPTGSLHIVDDEPAGEPSLQFRDGTLALIHPEKAFSPLIVDWVGGRSGHRRRTGTFAGGVLARAVKAGKRPTVVDATAGLGRDALVLASLGCTVLLIERNPALQALLMDAHQRLQRDDPDLAGRMRIVATDALAWRPQGAPPQVIHLDPMFPERSKSALVKQDMRWLQTVCGSDPDSAALLAHALTLGAPRVVVKRPADARPLSGPPPHHRLDGGQVGYDVYLA